MFYVLLSVGGLLLSIGFILFLIDSFRVHPLWCIGSVCVPFVYFVCLIMNWQQTKRGFLISLFGYPFIIGAILNASSLQPQKGGAKMVATHNDPFLNAINRARDVVEKVRWSRQDVVVAPTPKPGSPAPVAEANATPMEKTAISIAPAPTPVLTLNQRLANNRASFKALEGQFATLATRRKTLPKNDSSAIAAFNAEAKNYADKLAETRAEQADLLELERNAHP